jgi:hypothetical protein
MRLHRRHRSLVVWSSSADRADGWGAVTFNRPARMGRVRRCIRIGALVMVIAVRPRWRPLLGAAVLTVIGVTQGSAVGGIVLIPAFLLLWHAALIPADSDADRDRRSQLERELAAYSTPTQRFDLEATLDRYPDGITYEIRDILARQAVAAHRARRPGAGWR